jgi:hypothetical protein
MSTRDDIGLHLTFDQLALVYKSLQAAKTLGCCRRRMSCSRTRSSLSTSLSLTRSERGAEACGS